MKGRHSSEKLATVRGDLKQPLFDFYCIEPIHNHPAPSCCLSQGISVLEQLAVDPAALFLRERAIDALLHAYSTMVSMTQ